MISAADAYKMVMDEVRNYGTELVTLDASIGRVLAMDVYADRDMPPFNRVAMDGIAIAYDTWESGQRLFQIESVGAAGSPQQTLADKHKCIEIMTGAPLPHGTDTVIRYEDIEKVGDVCTINVDLTRGQNIHTQGKDHQKGKILLSPGHKIKAIDINILASVGVHQVEVYKKPRIAILSSGDELVPVEEQPLPYQIRRSNVHMLKARLTELNHEASTYHIQDDAEDIKNQLARILQDYDVILMSGGVSKGKFDYIPDVLNELGVEKCYHRVAQRPGKPMWFGKRGEKLVFAFPGNPVSTLACMHHYFIPWLRACYGLTDDTLTVTLTEDVSFKPDLTYFAQARLSKDEAGNHLATVRHGNGSGDMVNPAMMDGFIILPTGKETYRAGEAYPFRSFHTLY